MLADFVADVPVVGMQLLQLPGKGVGIRVGEFFFAETSDAIEHVQCPAAFLDGKIFERFNLLELRADFGRRNDDRPKKRFPRPAKRGEGQGEGILIAPPHLLSSPPSATAERKKQLSAPNQSAPRRGCGTNQNCIPKGPRQRLPVEFNTLVRECMELARVRHHLQAADLEYREVPSLSLQNGGGVCVLGDAEELRTAVSNLLDNAVKHSPDGVHISVELDANDEKQLALRVRDQGVGIPEQELKHIFRRFYRVTQRSLSQVRAMASDYSSCARSRASTAAVYSRRATEQARERP